MRKGIVVILLLGASLTAALLLSEVSSSSSAKLAFFDVGQGDAIFFQTRQGHQILIDGGPDSSVLSRLGSVMPFWDKTIDLVVLTHPDADHITGLVAVLERYEVKTVLWTGRKKDTKVFAAFAKALKKEDAREIIAHAGQRIIFGNSDTILEILYPFYDTDIQKGASNETSIIMRLVQDEHSVLLTGDTTKKIEKLLVEEGTDIKANILKIAHHGSKTSSSRVFLEAVDPEIAILSIGRDNRYGHPDDETLVNLLEYDIQVQRTDHEGTILFYFPLSK